MPSFNDPAYGFDPTQTGALSGQPAPWYGNPTGWPQPPAPPQAAPAAMPAPTPQPRGALSGLFSAIAMPLVAGLAGGRNLQEGLAVADQGVQQVRDIRKRDAMNAWLKAKSSGDAGALQVATQNLYQAAPEVAQSVIAAQMTPHPLVSRAPGDVMVDPFTGAPPPGAGAASGRGDGSAYDLENAAKAYDFQFGPAANRAMNAPDPQAWYKSAWPTYAASGQGAQPATRPAGQPASPQANPSAGGLPNRAPSEADALRWDRASNALVKNYIENPAYKLVANGGPFLARIDAAARLPGSAVNDQELLDSITKLNTGGGQVTEAQVNLVTKGQSLTDKINVWKQYMNAQGGVLSPDQRGELVTLAHRVFGEYQKLLTPYYKDATAKLKAQGVPPEYFTIPDVSSLSKQGGITDSGGGGDPLSQARDAIAKGAPRDAVIQRLQQNGINPSGL